MIKSILQRLRHKKKMILGIIFDFKNGVETNKTLSEVDLKLEKPEYFPYIPSDPSSLKKILKNLKIKSNDVFCDIGCGKGRALIIAKRFPFKKIIGIEISSKLVRIAQKNVTNCEFIIGDASTIPFPDEVTFAYMSSPFEGDVFHDFLQRIKESLERAPRPFKILYQTPIEHGQILKLRNFEELELPIQKFKHSYKLFQLKKITTLL